MQRMMSTKEAASLWNISDRQVSKLCGEGKIKGAVKKGRTWAIPFGTEKPANIPIKPVSSVRQPDLPFQIGNKRFPHNHDPFFKKIY